MSRKTYTLCAWCGVLVESIKVSGGHFLKLPHLCKHSKREERAIDSAINLLSSTVKMKAK